MAIDLPPADDPHRPIVERLRSHFHVACDFEPVESLDGWGVIMDGTSSSTSSSTSSTLSVSGRAQTGDIPLILDGAYSHGLIRVYRIGQELPPQR